MIRDRVTVASGVFRSTMVLIGRILNVAKLPLSLFVAYSALFGYLLASGQVDGAAITIFFGVLLLSGGAASLNNVQDSRVDRLMRRTRQRPMASGSLSPVVVLPLAGLLIVGGLLLLLGTRFAAAPPMLVALAAIVLYNGVYTPLKQASVWALLPGAICGALPPYIGWLAAGGPLFAVDILVAMSILLLWQVPHFWLIVLEYQDDYRKVAQPSMIDNLSVPAMRLLAVLWVIALVSAVHSLLLARHLSPWWMVVAIGLCSFYLVGAFGYGMLRGREMSYRQLFYLMNWYILGVITCFSLGSLDMHQPVIVMGIAL